MPKALRGIFSPVLTPFDAELQPDVASFIAHSKWLVANGAGLAIFGTNSEAASLSVTERIALTEQLLEAGVPASRLLPGTGACALPDAVALTRHAAHVGAPGVLVLPPFYFKNPSEEGVFAYFAELIERVGSDAPGIYLYHIPQLTQVPITLALIERLRKRYPQHILGAKDSSGDWANSKAMIDHFASDGFSVFPASESLLSQSLAIGGAGCISATINVNPGAIRQLYDNWDGPQGADLQANADAIRQIFQSVPMIPAMKRVVAEFTGKAVWQTVRPPLCPLEDTAAEGLLQRLQAAGFHMPGYPQ
jgi:4-hydroxy-tetrahydrodipicolinate synthase